MRQYLDLVNEVLTHGTRKPNRTGVDTISTFNWNYEIDLEQGFPLLTTKEISWKNIVIENLWFLSGQKHIRLLQKHGCRFWDAWADKDGFVPSAYGNFWRRFPTIERDVDLYGKCWRPGSVDQISWVIDELRRNPMSRRLVVSAWDPDNAHGSKLPPCHTLWVLNVQNKASADGVEQRLCLHLTQRSADVALGVPYNIAGYALIQSIIGHLVGIKPGVFAHTLIDAHVYTSSEDGSNAEFDHVPGLREQLGREPRPLPTLKISDDIKTLRDIEDLFEADTETIMSKFVLEGYDPHPKINFKVAV